MNTSIIIFLCTTQLNLNHVDIYAKCNGKNLCPAKREYSVAMKACISKFNANDKTNKGVNK